MFVNVKTAEMYYNKLLKLETGQVLRILLFSPTNINNGQKIFYDNHLKKYFIYDKFDVFKHETISRTHRFYFLVEYQGELKIIKTGFRLNDTIGKFLTENNINKDNLLKHYINIHIDIKKVQQFDSYDDCYCSIIPNIEKEDYFNSDEYLDLMKLHNNTHDSMMMSRNPFMIEYLNALGLIKPNDPLMRKIKILNLKNK
jgi:hypothetical protein